MPRTSHTSAGSVTSDTASAAACDHRAIRKWTTASSHDAIASSVHIIGAIARRLEKVRAATPIA